MRPKSPDHLAAFLGKYCEQHHHQVSTAILAGTVAGQAASAGPSALCGRELPLTDLAPPPLYRFFTAVVAIKAMKRYSTLARDNRRIDPLNERAIVSMASQIVGAALHLRTFDAATAVQHALERMSSFAKETELARTATAEVFDAHLRHMGTGFARQFLLYCAAGRTADLLFEVWLSDPRHPPAPDMEGAASYAQLVLPDAPLPEPGGSIATLLGQIGETAPDGHSGQSTG